MTNQLPLSVLLNSFNKLRKIDHKMTIQVATVFLAISENDGSMAVKDIAQNMGMAQSTASRCCISLTKWKNEYKKEAGYDLAIMDYDPADRRRKIIKLNESGSELVKRLSGSFDS